MTTYGWKLMAELHPARALVEQAVAAEAAGLEFVAISDHIHPWLPEHEHSPFAWSVLGGVAHATDRIELATGVTCPIGRYHPAIVAQAAATVATMTPGRRFTLAVGAGERLNEHVTGDEFPAVDLRHEMLLEACDIITALWQGDWVTIRGEHLDVEDARIFDLPEVDPALVVAVSGPSSLDVAQAAGADGIMATEPEASLPSGWTDRGGDGSQTWAEIPVAWAETEEEGQRLALERFRFGVPGWKVMAELPNPVNFDAALETVRPEDVAEMIPCGPDPERAAEGIRDFADAGFERISVVPVGDPAATLRFFTDEVLPLLG
ncbi:MAG: TIGR03557 family F420-dependent LLM class oxidoreductase [Acidimicrobiia bacterium]